MGLEEFSIVLLYGRGSFQYKALTYMGSHLLVAILTKGCEKHVLLLLMQLEASLK